MVEKRTHDKFYLHEAHKPVKESFKFIAQHIKDFQPENNEQVILGDMGCAIGTFPNYLSTQFKNYKIMGYEYLDELLLMAKKLHPHIPFKKLDVRNPKELPPKSLDIITMSGVLSIFDDYESVLKNIITWIKPKGRILIFSLFNPFDLDVFIKYKHSHEASTSELESGWNIISQKTIIKFLEKQKIYKFEFLKFNMSIDLEKNNDDKIRSWTEKNANGKRYIINGLNIKQPQYLLKIDF